MNNSNKLGFVFRLIKAKFFQLAITKYYFVFYFILFSIQTQAQDELVWSVNRKLVWEDFKGETDFKSRNAANSVTGLTYSYSSYTLSGKVQIDFVVNAVFYCLKSWRNPYDFTHITIGHEQLHFDITELFARKMRKKLRDMEFSENVEEEIQSVYLQILKDMNSYQSQYERETHSSLKNGASQKSWNLRVKKELLDYQDYKE